MERGINRKLRIRITGMLLGFVLFVGSTLTPAQTVYGDGEINRGKKTDTYKSHGRIEDAFSFSIKGDNLTVESVPQELVSKAKYISVTVYRAGIWENDKFIFESYNKGHVYRADEVSFPHTLPIPRDDGVYNCVVCVTGADGSSDSFNQHFTVENDAAFFSLSVNYENNEKIYEKKYKSDTALWAFTSPLYYKGKGEDKRAKLIKETAEKIVDKGDSDYEKIRKVHDWVADNIWYDWDYYRKKTDVTECYAYEVLKSKKTVCAGYADLTRELLRSLGIPTRTVGGIAAGPGGWESHAWNEVYADGRWIIVDTTWDSENRYEDGKFLEAKPCKREYFDITLEEISETHCYTQSEWDSENEYMNIVFLLEDSLSVSKKDLVVKKGKAKRIFVKSSGKGVNFKDLKITYSSTDKKVASVSKNGKVTAKKEGTAIIKTMVSLKEAGRDVVLYETKVTVRN